MENGTRTNLTPVISRQLTSILEKMGAISSAWPFMRLICRVYRPIVEREIKQLDLDSEDRVLFVGGGALPYSAVLFHELTGARIHVLDRDRQACLHSRRIQRRFSPGIFCVFCRCGKHCNPEHYSAIVVARQVAPKEEVVRYLVENAAPRTRILVREGSFGGSASRLIQVQPDPPSKLSAQPSVPDTKYFARNG